LEAEGVAWEGVERVFEAALEEDMGRKRRNLKNKGGGVGPVFSEENSEGNPAGRQTKLDGKG
jgi:hypothetical protein